MRPVPAYDLRSNIGTWAVPVGELPALASCMRDLLPPESFDLDFRGQDLETTYFDTRGLDLRKSRARAARYLTLRLRCYAFGHKESYALSAKTDEEKWRAPLTPATAHALLDGRGDLGNLLGTLLPGHLYARLLEVSREQPLAPAALVACRRYAVEDDTERYSLDIQVRTDTGKTLPYAVLEHKRSRDAPAERSPKLGRLGLWPIKLSKFLWATQP